MEQLTEAHLRYLLTVYEISLEEPDVSSINIAERLQVRKPTVSAMMDAGKCRAAAVAAALTMPETELGQ